MGNEPMNASNVHVAQRGEVNEQHQNVAKHIVQRDPIVLYTTHQTPQTSTQSKVVNVHNVGNHEPIEPFDKVVSIRQPRRSTTLYYYIPKRGSPRLVTTSIVFKTNHQTPRINLVPTNLEME
jgi:hypothetical protein